MDMGMDSRVVQGLHITPALWPRYILNMHMQQGMFIGNNSCERSMRLADIN